MKNLTFWGTYTRKVSQETIAGQLTSEFNIELLDNGRPEKFDELINNKGIQPNEIVVYFKNECGVVLFFNESIPTDWMEALAQINTIEDPTSDVSMKRYVLGKLDLNMGKGYIQTYVRANMDKHILKYSDALKFPVYPSDILPIETSGSLEKWINDESSSVLGVAIFNELYRSKNSDKRVTVFRFNNSTEHLTKLNSALTDQINKRKESNLTHFKTFVESRASKSAAFESNKNDKVIYQFLTDDYQIENYSNFICNHIGRHPDIEKIINTFLGDSNIEIIALIEEFAKQDINFHGLFDLVFYTGLYHTDDKVRAHALALALIITNGSFRPAFWGIWKKDFYSKKIVLSNGIPNSRIGLYYTNLLQHKFISGNSGETSAVKPLVIDTDTSGIEGLFLKYFNEVIIRDQERMINHEVFQFFETLITYGGTIKSLALINCGITKLHEGVSKLNLQKLDVSNNPIEFLGQFTYPSLEELVIRNTAIKTISLKNFPSLKKIVLENATELDQFHLVDINKLNEKFYFEVSQIEGAKKFYNFKKQEMDPFAAPAPKPFWKVW
ncbi:leucine-rich repeat domain-containing protein [Cytophaga aurantiaca]|uniref:leucine-rich repeat domain-containing protein n=1 Tax=Cytophaga aurantiaca TaxID=29530 RepID=UPI00035FECF8|nr:leucine-rich repeat domain-containing protein [Cytophaga aurantiaca]